MFLLYDSAKFLFSYLFKPVFKFKVIGRENVPKEGPLLLACNHASYLDPVLLATALPRRVNLLARENLFDKAWKRFILLRWKSIPMRREQLDKGVLKTVMGLLKEGEIVGLFPEGTRSPDENLLPGKAGVGMLVSFAKLPVLPVYMKGAYLTMGKVHRKFKCTPITVVFGKPMEFPKVEGEHGHDRYQRISDEVMAEIEKLKSSLE